MTGMNIDQMINNLHGKYTDKIVRHYQHVDSRTSEEFTIYVTAEGDRFYYSKLAREEFTDTPKRMFVGYLPNTAHGRYAFDEYNALATISPRRAFKKYHDDYFLETFPENDYAVRRATTPYYRRYFRSVGAIVSK